MRLTAVLSPRFLARLIGAAALMLVACSSSTEAHAQDASPGMLTIGSEAPSLDIGHWLSEGQGKLGPDQGFEDGKVYVVEFWATWCGPCIATMPHLAELQKKYADQGVQIVSISDEDLATVEGFLQINVQGLAEPQTYGELTSAYSLTTDPDGSTTRDYMEAAGRNTIPSAFIVGKTGLIEWMGNPVDMDDPLEQIVADRWDREAFQEMQRKQLEEEWARQMVQVKLQRAMLEVDSKLNAGEDEAALEIINDLADDDELEAMRVNLVIIRAKLAATIGGPAAVQAYNASIQALKEMPSGLNEIAWSAYEIISSGEGGGNELLSAALRAAELGLKQSKDDVSILDTIAHLHHQLGDLDKAIAAQEKALANAGDLAPQIKPYLDELKAEQAAQ